MNGTVRDTLKGPVPAAEDLGRAACIEIEAAGEVCRALGDERVRAVEGADVREQVGSQSFVYVDGRLLVLEQLEVVLDLGGRRDLGSRAARWPIARRALAALRPQR